VPGWLRPGSAWCRRRSKHPMPMRTPERFVRSIKQECLNRVIPFGDRHLRRLIAEYVEHYHRERNHQGLANELIATFADASGSADRAVSGIFCGLVVSLIAIRPHESR
jgi:hypothetical protein